MRSSKQLIEEISGFSSKVTLDAHFTIKTISNLIESNARVEDSIDKLHESINNASRQNELLQKRIYNLTIAAVILALIQVFAVVVDIFK